MDNRTNTIAGWVLAGCIVALGSSIAASEYFHTGRPEKMGYPIAGVQEEGSTGDSAAEVPIAQLLATADPAKGADVFKKCAACHTAEQGQPNGVGPNLYGVVGDAIAQGRGFDFSAALKAKGGKWDFDSLNAWLTSPRKFADGTKMTFAGLSSGVDRANVIAYLNTKGSNLPLPKPTGNTPGGASPAGVKGDGSAPKAPDHGDVKDKLAPGAPSNVPPAHPPKS